MTTLQPRLKEFLKIMAMCVMFIHAASGVASDPPDSKGESVNNFARWDDLTAPGPDGTEYFLGSPKAKRKEFSLYQFDPSTTLVTEKLTTGSAISFLRKVGGAHDLAINSSGTLAAVTVSVSRTRESGSIYNIYLIDLNNGDISPVVDNGRWNFGPAFSPDSQYLAYWSTDPFVGFTIGTALIQNAGCVVHLGTRKVATVLPGIPMDTTMWERWSPPQWIDSKRALFMSYTHDQSLVRLQIPEFSGKSCSFAAVVEMESGKISRFFMPGGYVGISAIIDKKRGRLILHNMRQIVETDFDLREPKIIAQAEDWQKIIQVQLTESGLKYSFAEKPKSRY